MKKNEGRLNHGTESVSSEINDERGGGSTLAVRLKGESMEDHRPTPRSEGKLLKIGEL